MQRSKCAFACLALWIAGNCFGQSTPAPSDQTTPAPAPAATPAPAPVWSLGGIDFSGFVDGYYNLNFNHPASKTNNLYNFDVKANQFSLSYAKLEMQHAADPVGFRLD